MGGGFATVEHLLSALHGCGIDNALVEVAGSELPILDGSARPFVDGFAAERRVRQPAPRHVLVINRPLCARAGERFVLVAPANARRFTVEIDFENAAIGRHRYSFDPEATDYREAIAPARTFGSQEDLDRLHRQGLARGGSQRNAVVIGSGRVLNPEGLRFPDEFVRHKVLDLIGDVSLAGVPVLGHFYGYRPGHELNTALLSTLMKRRDLWSIRKVDDAPREKSDDPLTALLADTDVTPESLVERLLDPSALGDSTDAQPVAYPGTVST